MATETNEGGDIQSQDSKSEEKSDNYGMEKQPTTMDQETFAEPNEKTVPTKKESFMKKERKSEGRKHLLKVVSSIGGDKEGSKHPLMNTSSWEQKVDESYTELILSLQEAWEAHVLKIRTQLREMVTQPKSKGSRDLDPKKSLFNIETSKGSTKEENKRLHLVVLISVSVALLAICVVNNVRIEALRNELSVVTQEYDLLREKIGTMVEKVDSKVEDTIRKQNKHLVEEMRKEIRYAFQMSSRETKVL